MLQRRSTGAERQLCYLASWLPVTTRGRRLDDDGFAGVDDRGVGALQARAAARKGIGPFDSAQARGLSERCIYWAHEGYVPAFTWQPRLHCPQ